MGLGRLGLIGMLAALGLLRPVPLAQAAVSTTWERMVFDIPDGWTRKDVNDGILLQRSFETSSDGRPGKPGMAIIEVHRPIPTSAGSFEEVFARFARSLPDLAGERPMLHGAGVTVNGHPIVYEHRCCGNRTGVSIGGDYVGISARTSYHVLRLVTLNLRGDAEKRAEDEFGALVRSLRPTAGDRAFELVPPAGGGGLDGVFTFLDTGLRPNVFGGLDFYSDSTVTVFDRAGLYSTAIPPGDMDLPGFCRTKPTECGTYKLTGAGLFSGPGQIEMTEVSTRYAILRPSAKPFARVGGDLRIGGRDYRRIEPLPAGTPFEGTWRYTFASAGSMAFSSGSVAVERTLHLTRDGQFTRTGFAGFSSSTETGGSRTGVAGGGNRPLESGRYRVEGYHLVLTGDDGRSETLSLFAPDRGSDGLLIINGGNYLKQDRPPRGGSRPPSDRASSGSKPHQLQ